MQNEILLIMGYPGAGKTTTVERYLAKGYQRLNRDMQGGTLAQLNNELEAQINLGQTKFVLDNTYPTIDSRAPIVAIGKKYNMPVNVLLMGTTIEEAQFNVVQRMLEKHGTLIEADQMRKLKDTGLFPAMVLFHYRKIFQAPTLAEGFTSITVEPFKRRPFGFNTKGIIFDYDGTLRKCKDNAKYPTTKEQIEILPGRPELLRKLIDCGYKLCGVSNQSGVSKGVLTHALVSELFEHTNQLLGLKADEIDVAYCPHAPMPLNCYCRKPMPGHGVRFIHKHKLNPADTLMIGDLKTDQSFAQRSGFKFVHADNFFATPNLFIPELNSGLSL